MVKITFNERAFKKQIEDAAKKLLAQEAQRIIKQKHSGARRINVKISDDLTKIDVTANVPESPRVRKYRRIQVERKSEQSEE